MTPAQGQAYEATRHSWSDPMRLMKYVLALAALLGSQSALAQQQNTTPSSVAVGSYRDRSGLDKPLQAFTLLAPDGSYTTDTNDMQAVTPIASLSGLGTLFTADMTGFRGLVFQLTGAAGNTFSFECSNDNVTYAACSGMNLNSNSYASTTTLITTPFYMPTYARWFRVRMTTYVSGTTSATAYMRQVNLDPGQVSGQVTNVKSVFYNDYTNAALAANATSTGPTRDAGVGQSTSYTNAHFSCFASLPVASAGAILNMQASTDNFASTNVTVLSAAVASGLPVSLESRIYYRYHRCQVVNGSAAQTNYYLAGQVGE